MRLLPWLSGATIIITLTMLSAPVGACTADRRQTRPEYITAKAERILRAEVIRYDPGGSERNGNVTFKVLEILKGDFAASFITLPGQTEYYEGKNDQEPPYRIVRPGGRHGNCFASDYKMGGQFLLFLADRSVEWAPLAAVNEEISNEDDPWVWWVKGFLAAEIPSEILERATNLIASRVGRDFCEKYVNFDAERSERNPDMPGQFSTLHATLASETRFRMAFKIEMPEKPYVQGHIEFLSMAMADCSQTHAWTESLIALMNHPSVSSRLMKRWRSSWLGMLVWHQAWQNGRSDSTGGA
jgi:hypothetical protein